MILAFFILLFLDRYFWVFDSDLSASLPVFSYGVPPGGRDSVRLLKYPNIICLYAKGQKRSCIGVFATFVCKPVPKQYIIRMLQHAHMGICKGLT